MPDINLFLPPLLGGFLFVTLWHPLRYWAEREQGYKLVFAASILGGLFLVLAHLILNESGSALVINDVLLWWDQRVQLTDSAASVLGFLLGATLWAPANLMLELFPQTQPSAVLQGIIQRKGDPFEQMMFDHLQAQDLVLVSLKSNKVYVGRVEMSLNPARGVNSIRLVLSKSGYRDPVDHQVHLNVDYDKTHARIRDQIRARYAEAIDEYLSSRPKANYFDVTRALFGKLDVDLLGTLNFEVVILASEIQSVSPFDPDIFRDYFDDTRTKPGERS